MNAVEKHLKNDITEPKDLIIGDIKGVMLQPIYFERLDDYIRKHGEVSLVFPYYAEEQLVSEDDFEELVEYATESGLGFEIVFLDNYKTHVLYFWEKDCEKGNNLHPLRFKGTKEEEPLLLYSLKFLFYKSHNMFNLYFFPLYNDESDNRPVFTLSFKKILSRRIIKAYIGLRIELADVIYKVPELPPYSMEMLYLNLLKTLVGDRDLSISRFDRKGEIIYKADLMANINRLLLNFYSMPKELSEKLPKWSVGWVTEKDTEEFGC